MGSQKDSDATEDTRLYLWCHIQEFIAKSSVMEHFFYVFFQFGALCLGLNPFRINFCICYKVRVQFYYFACGYPHAAGIPNFPAAFVKEQFFPHRVVLAPMLKII